MIDSADKRILYALDFHARGSFAALARKLKMREETFHYRVKQMEKKGLITGYYIVPDSAKMGKVSYKIMLKYQNVDAPKEKEFLSYLIETKEAGWVVKTEGYYDLMFMVWVGNENEFDLFFTKFLERYSSFFYLRDVIIVIEHHACRRAYLSHTGGKKEEVSYSGEARNICDETDLKIIELLTKNSRMPAVEIAPLVGLTAEAVGYRIKELKRNGVILAFRPRINLNKIGHYFYNILFRLNRMSSIPKFFTFARQNPNVVYFVRYVGMYDLGFDLEVESPEEFRKIVDELRGLFGQYIINYNYVLIYDELKITY